MSILSCIDMFSFPIRVTFKKSINYSTTLGGLTTILFFCLMMTSAVFFGRELYERISPKVIIQEENDEVNPIVNLTKDAKIFGINFIGHDSKLFNITGIFEFSTAYRIQVNDTYLSKKIEMDYCSNLYNYTDLHKELDYAHCMKDLNHSLSGTFTDYEYSFISIYAGFCVNTTENNNHCQPLEIINQYNGIFLVINYFDNLLLPFDHTRPLQAKINKYWDFLDFSTYNHYEVFFKNITLETEDGLIFQNDKIQKDIMIDEIIPRKAPNPRVIDDGFFQLDFFLGNKHLKVKRIYVKIQTVIAELGGLMKFLFFFGKIFIYVFGRRVYELDLVNTFLNCESEYENRRIVDLKETVHILDKSPRSTFLDKKSVSSKNITLNLTKQSNIFKDFLNTMNKVKLNYTSKEFLQSILCPSSNHNYTLNKKEKMRQSAVLYIANRFDFINLDKKISDIEILKDLILNEQQNMLLDFIDKPNLNSISDNKLDQIESESESEDFSKLSKIMNYYYHLLINDNFSVNDKKLFSRVNKEFLDKVTSSYLQ